MTALNTRPPSTLALGLARASVELKTFFRVREAVVFTFSLPIIMLAILGSVFSEEISGHRHHREPALRGRDHRRRCRLDVVCQSGHRDRHRP